jgi:hypothetical protein
MKFIYKIESGMRFGRQIVIKEVEKRKDARGWRRYFLVKCDCGNIREARGTTFASGRIKSCGCYGEEKRRESVLILDRSIPAFNTLYVHYKKGARKRGYSWELSKEQFKILTSSPCHYTNRSPETIIKTPAGSEYVYNGVDRINSDYGYTLENCVPCCKEVNYAKQRLSKQDFLALVKEVYEHSIRK